MTVARAYEYAITGSEAVLESARTTLSAYHCHVRKMLCYGAALASGHRALLLSGVPA